MFRSPLLSATTRATSSIFRLTVPRTTTIIRPVSSAGVAKMRVSDPIKEDHRELESYYHQIIKATDNDTKTRYQNQFTWELARHSIAEELLIYPIMEKKVEGGKEKADRDREEHRKIKELLKQFQNLDASEGLFLTTIEGLMRDLRQHTKEEEEDDLPALERVLSVEESDELSKSFERTKMLTPTRSHPSAPDKPPFETVVGLMAAPIDHVADLFRKFPKE